MTDQIDRLINLDFGGRGNEGLFAAARMKIGKPLAGAAAEALAAIPRNSKVLITTGSAPRSWIAPHVCENDGPAGAAVVASALAFGLGVIPIILAEAAILPQLQEVFRSAGLTMIGREHLVRHDHARSRLGVAVLCDYPTEDIAGQNSAGPILEELQPALVFSTERTGRNRLRTYRSMRGEDYGEGRARIDYVFDEAILRGIPSIAVGDGGNEIGMGLIADAVAEHVAFGRPDDPCGGIGAITTTDFLVTAGCSNWGCYAIVACLAKMLGRLDLLHTAEDEDRLLRRGVDIGLMNAINGRVDPHVDGIAFDAHKSMVTLIGELASRS